VTKSLFDLTGKVAFITGGNSDTILIDGAHLINL
jgi:hypothetical protein